jgi:hypothetical protein
MANITAIKAENDGRQWYAVTFVSNQYTEEAGTHAYAVAADGELLNSDGAPVDYNEYLSRAIMRAIEAA